MAYPSDNGYTYGAPDTSGTPPGYSYFPTSYYDAQTAALDSQKHWDSVARALGLQGADNAMSGALGLGNLQNQSELGRLAGLQSGIGGYNQAMGNYLQGTQQGTNEAMGAANLAASLRGPANAFQQQAVMHGLNQSGMSNLLAGITGHYNVPSFGQTWNTPYAANLGTLQNDFNNAGGQSQNLSPAQLAMLQSQQGMGVAQGGINAANQLMQSPSPVGIAQPYLSALGQVAGQYYTHGVNNQATGQGVPAGYNAQAPYTNPWGETYSPPQTNPQAAAPGQSSALNAATAAYNQMYQPPPQHAAQPSVYGQSTGGYQYGNQQMPADYRQANPTNEQAAVQNFNPSQMNLRAWNNANSDDKAYIGSAFEGAGYSPSSVYDSAQKQAQGTARNYGGYGSYT